jgi:hypothetical protein
MNWPPLALEGNELATSTDKTVQKADITQGYLFNVFIHIPRHNN